MVWNQIPYIRFVNYFSFHTTHVNSNSQELNFIYKSDCGNERFMTGIPHRGDKVSLRTEYFYSEACIERSRNDAPGSTYDNVNMFINEILHALAASGSGVLRLTEGQLIDLAVGDPRYTEALIPFFSSNFDTTDVSKPHAYLVWMLYDNDMKLIVEGSGAKRVTDPNALKELLEEDIPVIENGYLHAYVSNGGIEATSFDNFLVTYMRGNTRQINHYYPYGLSIAGLGGDYDEYLNKYTSKELQTGEFGAGGSTGLEMFDFGSRFYDPQIGRWHTPDPAEQFANPYLAMGNNPVMYVDPDGEFAMILPLIVAGGIVAGSFQQASTSNNSFGQLLIGGAIGGASAAAGFGVGSALSGVVGAGFIGGAISGAGGGFTGGFISGGGSAWYNGASLQDGMMAGLKSGGIAAASAALTGGLIGGISAKNAGLDFLTGSKVTDLEKFGRSLGLDLTASINNNLGSSLANPTTGNDEQDFLIMLKAYADAKKLTIDGQTRIQELFDMDGIHYSKSWSQNAIFKDTYTREFKFNSLLIKAGITNQTNPIVDVSYVAKFKTVSLIMHDGRNFRDLSTLTFENKEILNRAWGNIIGRMTFSLSGPSKVYIK